jgi:hypothetical protein
MPAPGEAHGRSTLLRWDTTTAAGAIVIGALAFLIFVHFNFSAGAHIGAGAHR